MSLLIIDVALSNETTVINMPELRAQHSILRFDSILPKLQQVMKKYTLNQ